MENSRTLTVGSFCSEFRRRAIESAPRLGTLVLDTWIPWNRHGASNCLFLDGHVQSLTKGVAYPQMYPGGYVYPNEMFYP
jgi:prepilin-type processing-associated H-X9-DG protein